MINNDLMSKSKLIEYLEVEQENLHEELYDLNKCLEESIRDYDFDTMNKQVINLANLKFGIIQLIQLIDKLQEGVFDDSSSCCGGVCDKK